MDATRRMVVNAITDSLDLFCDKMQKHVDAGDCTRDDVLIALGGYPDFQDNWIDWMEEADK